MKKITALLLCFIMLISLTSCGENDGPKEITILTLDNYLPQETIKEFTEDTGIAVKQVTASTYEQIQEMVEKNPSAYDVVIASDYIMDSLVKGNLLQEIDYKKFPNDKYVIPGYKGKYYDPENKFTVPYASVGILIAYNPYEAGIIIDSYAGLLAPSLKDSIVFADDSEVLVGISNLIVGKDAWHVAEVMDDTIKILHALSDNSYTVPANAYAEDALISGDASVGLLYTSQLGYAMYANPELEIVFPKEGFLASIDSMAIPAKADGKNYAMQFINYAHDPVVNGKLAQNISYSTTNISGKQFMDEEYRNDGYNMKNDRVAECILFPKLEETTARRFENLYRQHFINYRKNNTPASVGQAPTPVEAHAQ